MRRVRRGDTLIEVAIAIAIFSLVSVITIMLMDHDLSLIQGSLELEMARNEIDAQAEAIRFIHNSYLSERELVKGEREYQHLWLTLSRGVYETAFASSGEAGRGLSNNPATISNYPDPELTCSAFYDATDDGENDITKVGDTHSLFADSAFIINTRNMDPSSDVDDVIIRSVKESGGQKNTKVFVETSLYPRLVFTEYGSEAANTSDEMDEIYTYDKVYHAEGIWVIAARDATDAGEALTESTDLSPYTPEFYDFHIRTCWFAPAKSVPSTIATIIRLYNPEYVEGTR